MRKLEGIEACRNCVSRNFVNGKGLVCKLTGENPTLESECTNFTLDEELTNIAPIPEEEVAEEIDMNALRSEENLPMGILAGLLACLVGAAVWALVSVSTGYQIGYMAIGMGFIVGYAVRIAGKGVSQIFGIAGAALALLGCVLGDYFSIIGFIASDEGLGYMETLSLMPVGEMIDILIENLMSMTILFYGIALFEGYKLSFRLQVKSGGQI
ncbi:hypothetical protein [Bacteroides sp. 51]|uniref:hypothetical protein n=1 Tax=Bacteroides sp. 51 TaxID=2302938 RepID=UPI0013D7906E|nr:hypothetical protein [Bacteroides sp. 51]NDV82381.1 hypothetical protein [Bacteroides sp. 51]